MKNDKKSLLKIFSGILRKRALAEKEAFEVSAGLLSYLSRKDLIAIIKEKFKGTVPKEHNLEELENEDLLKIIEDDIFIIAFITKKWSQNLKKEALIEIKNDLQGTPKKAVTTISSQQKKKK